MNNSDPPQTIEALENILCTKTVEELTELYDDIRDDPQGFAEHVGPENAQRFLNSVKKHLHIKAGSLNRAQRRALESKKRDR